MEKNKQRLRKCIVCNEYKEKKDLIRIVKNNQGEVFIDFSGKLNGRGAYISKDNACIDKAVKNKLLNRHLKTNVDESIYTELNNMKTM